MGSLFGDRVHIYHAVIVMRNLGAGRGETFPDLLYVTGEIYILSWSS